MSEISDVCVVLISSTIIHLALYLLLIVSCMWDMGLSIKDVTKFSSKINFQKKPSWTDKCHHTKSESSSRKVERLVTKRIKLVYKKVQFIITKKTSWVECIQPEPKFCMAACGGGGTSDIL